MEEEERWRVAYKRLALLVAFVVAIVLLLMFALDGEVR